MGPHAPFLTTAILIALSFLASCGAPASPAPTEAPPALETASPHPATKTEATVVVDATPSSVDESVQEFPVAGIGADIAIQPGRYKTPEGLEIPFEFDIGEGFTWFAEYLQLNKALVLVRGSNAAGKPSQWLAFMPLSPGETVESAMEALRSTPKMELLDEAEVSIGGAKGRQLNSAARGLFIIPAISNLTGNDGGVWSTESPDVLLRFYTLDVGGRTLLIYVEAPPDEFDDFAREVERMLQTIRFEQ